MNFLNKALTSAALVAATGIIALGGALPASAAPCLPGFSPTKGPDGNNTCMSRETGQVDPAGISPDAPASFRDPAAMRNPAAVATTGPGQNTVDVGRTGPAVPPVATPPAVGSPEAVKASAAAAAAAKETEARLPSDKTAVDRTSSSFPIPVIIALIVGALLAAALGTLAVLKKRKKDAESPSEKAKPVAKEKAKKVSAKPEVTEPSVPEEPAVPAVPLTRREMKERNSISE